MAAMASTPSPLPRDRAALGRPRRRQATLGASTDTLARIENVTGSGGHNDLRGDGGANRLAGDDSDDFMDGRGGDDVLTGAGANDTLYGGGGNDSLDAGKGNDGLYGQAGDDEIAAAAATTRSSTRSATTRSRPAPATTMSWARCTVNGDAGDDDLYASGTTVLRGGAGHDHLHCGTGAQRLDYNATSEDDPSPQSPLHGTEIIFGFNGADGDRLDVSTIDANLTVAGNQAFTFVGSTPVDRAGEMASLSPAASPTSWPRPMVRAAAICTCRPRRPSAPGRRQTSSSSGLRAWRRLSGGHALDRG